MTTYLATDTELRSIANKIREKGNTTDILTFPGEFVNAIDALSGSGKYAWKKYEVIGSVTNPTIDIVNRITTNDGTYSGFIIDNIDPYISAFVGVEIYETLEFLNGFEKVSNDPEITGAGMKTYYGKFSHAAPTYQTASFNTYNGTSYIFYGGITVKEKTDGTHAAIITLRNSDNSSNASSTYYSPAIGQTLTYSGVKELPTQTKNFIEIVTSNNANAYPDGEYLGGYYYERLGGETAPKFAFGTVKPSVSTYLSITHSLGFKPNWFVALGTSNSSSYTHGAAYNKDFNATYVYVQGRYNTVTKAIGTTKNSNSNAYIDETIITIPYYNSTYTWYTSDNIIWACGE